MVTEETQKIEKLLNKNLDSQEEKKLLYKIDKDPILQKKLNQKIAQQESNNFKKLLDTYFDNHLQKPDNKISEKAKQAAKRMKEKLFKTPESELLNGLSPFKICCQIYKCTKIKLGVYKLLQKKIQDILKIPFLVIFQ